MNSAVIWFLVGLGLLLAELLAPGLIVLFFGIGAWVTALCCLLFDVSLNAQLAIFLVSSVVTLSLLRRWLRRKYSRSSVIGHKGNIEDDYIGEKASATSSFRAGEIGKVSFRGTTWDAVSQQHITEGQQVVIIGYQSIRLIVEPYQHT